MQVHFIESIAMDGNIDFGIRENGPKNCSSETSDGGYQKASQQEI